MKKLLLVLLVLVVMGLQVQRVSCPEVASDISTRAGSESKPSDLPPEKRNCTCEYEIFCSPRTQLAEPVPWIAFILSSAVSLAPFIRVQKLGPHVQGDNHTLFWWFLAFNFAAYMLWGEYTWSCNYGDPIQLASFVGAVISFVLLFTAYSKLPEGDLRWYYTWYTVVMIFLGLAALSYAEKDVLGWLCLAVTILAHFFRIGATNYKQFNGVQFCASIVGTLAGFLWLRHPDLCVAKHYKITSYIVSCLRGLETFLWCSPKVAKLLGDLETRSRLD